MKNIFTKIAFLPFVFSVADGVGGWNRQGIDPSVFSFNLEKNILDQLKAGMDATSLLRLTNRSYNKIKSEDVIHGSATLTSLSIDKINHVLYTSNLGDSGFLVIRSGAIYDLSSPQQHFFNAPFQLANAPLKNKNAMRDQPDHADFKNMVIKSGDIILAFSDGVSDNLFEYELRELILEKLPDLPNDNLEIKLQILSCEILTLARKKSQDHRFYSPFARSAKQNGYRYSGGKKDDSTLIISLVH